MAAFPVYSQNLFTGIWVCEEEWDGVPVKDYFTFNSDGSLVLGIDFGFGEGYKKYIYYRVKK